MSENREWHDQGRHQGWHDDWVHRERGPRHDSGRDRESPRPATGSKPWHAVALTLGGAAAAGIAVYVAARLAGVVSTSLMYHVLIFGAFWGLYVTMPGGFEANFNVPVKKEMTFADVLYYTMVCHSTAGFGDMYPTSFYARVIVSLHLGLVFLATAGLVPLGR